VPFDFGPIVVVLQKALGLFEAFLIKLLVLVVDVLIEIVVERVKAFLLEVLGPEDLVQPFLTLQ